MKNPFVDESALEEKPIEKSEYEKMVEEAEKNTEVVFVATYMPLGLMIGIAVGAIVGLVLGDIKRCVAAGMIVGVAVGMCFHKHGKSQ